MSEPLESLALEAARRLDDKDFVNGLPELLRALAGACRERDVLSTHNQRLQADLDGLHKSISEIAEEIEAAIPTKPGQLLANLVREGVTALQSHIVYAAESLRAQEPAAWAHPAGEDKTG